MGVPINLAWRFILLATFFHIALCVDLRLQLGKDKDGKRVGWRWSSILQYDNDEAINSDDLLAGFAQQGCIEMGEKFAELGTENGEPLEDNEKAPGKRFMPGAMSALRIGNEVWMSSSMKGYEFVYTAKPSKGAIRDQVCEEVRAALLSCWTTAKEEHDEGSADHGNRGSCGEVMLAQMYCNKYGKALGNDQTNPKYKVVTWNCNKRPGFVMPACTEKEKGIAWWGCDKFTPKMGMEAISQVNSPEAPKAVPVGYDNACIY
jgi:hypothetical protein